MLFRHNNLNSACQSVWDGWEKNNWRKEGECVWGWGGVGRVGWVQISRGNERIGWERRAWQWNTDTEQINTVGVRFPFKELLSNILHPSVHTHTHLPLFSTGLSSQYILPFLFSCYLFSLLYPLSLSLSPSLPVTLTLYMHWFFSRTLKYIVNVGHYALLGSCLSGCLCNIKMSVRLWMWVVPSL